MSYHHKGNTAARVRMVSLWKRKRKKVKVGSTRQIRASIVAVAIVNIVIVAVNNHTYIQESVLKYKYHRSDRYR